MAVAFVSGGSGNGSTASLAVTITSTTGGTGHDLFVVVGIRNSSSQTVTSITATGVTFRKIQTNQSSTTIRLELWAAIDIPAGVTSVTVNLSVSAKLAVAIGEYSGVAQWGKCRAPVTQGGVTGATVANIQSLVRNGNFWLQAGAAQGTGTFSGTTGSDHVRESTASSGSSGATNVGAFLTDHAATADMQQITTSTIISSSAVFNQLGLELTATADGTNNANIVAVSQAFWNESDQDASASGIPDSVVLRKVMNAGDLIVWGGQWENVSVDNPIGNTTDTDGNSYAGANGSTPQADPANIFGGTIIYAANIAAGSATQWNIISSTGGPFNNPPNLGSYAGIFVVVYTGVTSAPLDQVASANGNSAAPSSGATPSTTSAGEIVFGLCGCETGGTLSAGSGFSLEASQSSNVAGSLTQSGVEDKTVTSTGAQTATFSLSTSGNWVALVATFILSFQVLTDVSFDDMNADFGF